MSQECSGNPTDCGASACPPERMWSKGRPIEPAFEADEQLFYRVLAEHICLGCCLRPKKGFKIMKNYEIVAILSDSLEELDDLAERVYAKLNDVTLGRSKGQVHICFDREASSLEEAMASAQKDLANLKLNYCSINRE